MNFKVRNFFDGQFSTDLTLTLEEARRIYLSLWADQVDQDIDESRQKLISEEMADSEKRTEEIKMQILKLQKQIIELKKQLSINLKTEEEHNLCT